LGGVQQGKHIVTDFFGLALTDRNWATFGAQTLNCRRANRAAGFCAFGGIRESQFPRPAHSMTGTDGASKINDERAA